MQGSVMLYCNLHLIMNTCIVVCWTGNGWPMDAGCIWGMGGCRSYWKVHVGAINHSWPWKCGASTIACPGAVTILLLAVPRGDVGVLYSSVTTQVSRGNKGAVKDMKTYIYILFITYCTKWCWVFSCACVYASTFVVYVSGLKLPFLQCSDIVIYFYKYVVFLHHSPFIFAAPSHEHEYYTVLVWL